MLQLSVYSSVTAAHNTAMSSCLAGMASTMPLPSVTSACPNDGQSTHIASWSTFEVSGGPLPQRRWVDTVGGAHMVVYGDVLMNTSCTKVLPSMMPRLSPFSATDAQGRQRECALGVLCRL
jgi:hypothetical protein